MILGLHGWPFGVDPRFWAAEVGGTLASVRSFRKGVSPEFTGIYIFRGGTFIRTYHCMALLAMLDILTMEVHFALKMDTV
jgi:hypothetical protein